MRSYMATDTDRSGSLTVWTFFNMFLRSFFIQGTFSLKYRQNIGFAFCMEPAGKALWSSPESLRAFTERHMEYYNGNPFMITLVLGSVARLEELVKKGEMSERDILGFKKAVGAATGSIGDRLFWGTLRPFGIITGLAAVMFHGFLGVILALALFNIPNIALRWYWLMRGYSLGTGVVEEIQNKNIQRAIVSVENVSAALVAFLTMLLISPGNAGSPWSAVGATVLFSISLLMYRKNKSVSMMLGATLGIIIISGMVISFVFL